MISPLTMKLFETCKVLLCLEDNIMGREANIEMNNESCSCMICPGWSLESRMTPLLNLQCALNHFSAQTLFPGGRFYHAEERGHYSDHFQRRPVLLYPVSRPATEHINTHRLEREKDSDMM